MARRASLSAAAQLTFRVGRRRLAVPAARVREVTRLPRMTRVPLAPASLLGLANLRGAVLPVISLGALLGDVRSTPTRVLVIEGEDPIGLAVDTVEAVREKGAGRSDAKPLALEPLLGPLLDTGEAGTGGYRRVASAARSTEGASLVPLLAFLVGRQEFALPLESVEEIVRLDDGIAALPDGDAAVIGTTAVRGELLPLLSLGALLGLDTGDGRACRHAVVARIGRHRVGLAVDAIRAVLRVPADMIDPVPPVLARGTGEARVQAICRIDGGRRLVSVLAAEHLLREELTARLLEGRAEARMSEVAVAEDTTEQFLLFRIGEESFGLPLASVEEVARLPERLTRLPNAPAFVEGVINLRGSAVPVIDQARRFSGRPASGTRRRVVVVGLGEMRAGFLVDAVSEVLRVPAAALRPAPDLGDDETRVFDRVANLEESGRVVLIVSPQQLLDRAERDLVAALQAKDAAGN